MFVRRMIPVTMMAMLAFSIPVHAQSAQPAKIAVADTGMIFRQMQETKDLTVQFNNQTRSLKATAQQRQTDIENLRNTRDQFKADSSQWTDANEKLLKAAVEDQSWLQLSQIDLARKQKLRTKQVFDKIQAECAAVAKQMGYDIVIAKQMPELMNSLEDPKVSVNEFLSQMAQYNVLYAAPSVDITDKVIAALDANYRSSGAAAPAPSGK